MSSDRKRKLSPEEVQILRDQEFMTAAKKSRLHWDDETVRSLVASNDADGLRDYLKQLATGYDPHDVPFYNNARSEWLESEHAQRAGILLTIDELNVAAIAA